MSAAAPRARTRRWITGLVAAGVLAGCAVAGAAGSPVDDLPVPTPAPGPRVQDPVLLPARAQEVRVAARNLYGPYTLTISPVSARADVDDSGTRRVGVRVDIRCMTGSCLLGRYAFALQGAGDRRAVTCLDSCFEPALPAESELETNGHDDGYVTWIVQPGRYRLSYQLDGVNQPAGTLDVLD